MPHAPRPRRGIPPGPRLGPAHGVPLVVALLVTAVVASLAVVAVVASSAHDRAGADPRPDNRGWAASWSAAMTPPGDSGPAARGVRNATVRQEVHLSLGGERLRLRLSHEYGARAVQVAGATVSVGGRAVPVLFGGDRAVTVPAGVEVVSDPVALDVADDADLIVDLYLPTMTGPLTQHPRGGSTTLVAAGDHAGSASVPFRPLGSSRLLLSGVDVDSDRGTIVAFGDSITDGTGSSVDAHHTYPQLLADRVLDEAGERAPGVVNAGISGNQLLADGVDRGGAAGVSALSRFDSDVLDQPGVQVVILLEGINDIQRSRGALHPQALRSGYSQFVARAHARGIAVVGATLLPYEGWKNFTAAGEADRRDINAWIRTSGVFDAVVDLAAAVRDPQNPTRLHPDFDSGDGIHPNDAGYAAMAAAFDVDALLELARR